MKKSVILSLCLSFSMILSSANVFASEAGVVELQAESVEEMQTAADAENADSADVEEEAEGADAEEAEAYETADTAAEDTDETEGKEAGDTAAEDTDETEGGEAADSAAEDTDETEGEETGDTAAEDTDESEGGEAADSAAENTDVSESGETENAQDAEASGEEPEMPELVDWNHFVADLLTYDVDPETFDLVIYPEEEKEITLDYSRYCSPEDVAGIYWCDYNDGCSYSFAGIPYAECLDDYDWVSESPYLTASLTDNGISVAAKVHDGSCDDYIAVLVLCKNGDYYWDRINYCAEKPRSEIYKEADILNFRTKNFPYKYLYVEVGESCHLDLSYSQYCTDDEVESITISAWNDLTGEDGRTAYTEDNIPQFKFTRDATGWIITGQKFENDEPWVWVEVWVKLNNGQEGLCEGFYLEQVDPDDIPEGWIYDRDLHYVFDEDTYAEYFQDSDSEEKNVQTAAGESSGKDNSSAAGAAGKNTSPKTGDSNHPELWLILAAVSAAGIFRSRKRAES